MLEQVSTERLARFFADDGTSMSLRKEVREMCIFSSHSLIRDPPFSRMDLISCRNLLIYLAVDSQAQIIQLFHYALVPSGYLFLGMSENVGRFQELFAPVDKRKRIFQAQPDLKAAPPFLGRYVATTIPAKLVQAAESVSLEVLRRGTEQKVLDLYAPPHVVVNIDGDIIFYSARTGRYLEAGTGYPSNQLMSMARKGIKLDLRDALAQATTEGRRIERLNLRLEGDTGRFVKLTVEPITFRNAEIFYLVVFDDMNLSDSAEPEAVPVDKEADAVAAGLERELLDTRERLQSVVEEYETALEELKSSNEELLSVNEELEASREELQSLNEELQIVNAELSQKVDEADMSNSDLRNLFDNTKVAAIFVDGELKIRNFTQLAGEVFDLVRSDRGRPLATFAGRITYDGLSADLAAAVADGASFERRVGRRGSPIRYLVRVQPYTSGGGVREGATITMLDITDLTAD